MDYISIIIWISVCIFIGIGIYLMILLTKDINAEIKKCNKIGEWAKQELEKRKEVEDEQ